MPCNHDTAFSFFLFLRSVTFTVTENTTSQNAEVFMVKDVFLLTNKNSGNETQWINISVHKNDFLWIIIDFLR